MTLLHEVGRTVHGIGEQRMSHGRRHELVVRRAWLTGAGGRSCSWGHIGWLLHALLEHLGILRCISALHWVSGILLLCHGWIIGHTGNPAVHCLCRTQVWVFLIVGHETCHCIHGFVYLSTSAPTATYVLIRYGNLPQGSSVQLEEFLGRLCRLRVGRPSAT